MAGAAELTQQISAICRWQCCKLLLQSYLREDIQKGIDSLLWRLCYRDTGNLMPLVICMPAAFVGMFCIDMFAVMHQPSKMMMPPVFSSFHAMVASVRTSLGRCEPSI